MTGPRILCLATLYAIAGATSASAQAAPRIALPDGRTLEVLGLRRWTVAMIQDSLARYAPKDSLQSHACAAVLRYTLGFADAASTTFIGPDGTSRVVVAVREPQDSARVHFRLVKLDSLHPRVSWRVATAVMQRRPDIFWPAIQHYLKHDGSAAPTWRSRADSTKAAALVGFLSARTSPNDFRTARRVIGASSNMYDRAIAALILANFPQRDEAWWALAETLREVDGPTRGVAAETLDAMSRRHPRRVQWTPVASGIHAMLDGTSLYMVPTLLEVLARTQAGPTDAVAFLHNGGDMVVRYLDSGEPSLASRSRALLVQLHGGDLGSSAQAWREWITTL
jgi:hypothetical protein